MTADLRQIEAVLQSEWVDKAREILEEAGAEAVWVHSLDDDHSSVRAAVPSRSSEAAMDELHNVLSDDPLCSILLTDILVALPRREEPDSEEDENEAEEPKFGPDRVGREELYQQAARGGRISPIYLIMAALSALVASVGVIRDNTAVVIGAMVIAPLLGPSVALSLGSTLGDTRLMKRAGIAAGAGFLISLGVSLLVGLVVDIDLASQELTSRTDIGLAEVILAIASGIAAALAFTTGASSAFIGVMVAVALLPPTVAFGMLVSSGEWTLARGAGLLVLVNLAAVNVTSVGTFIAQGVRPATWYEKERAKKSMMIAIVVWGFLLIVLGVAIWLNNRIVD